MFRVLALAPFLIATSGCLLDGPYGGPLPQPAVAHVENPLFLPQADHQDVWTMVVDVTDDYFKIEREDPIRLVGSVLTEGRLDTFPQVGSTVFEPWRHDSAGMYDKLESTVQSIRRYAKVRIIPDRGGYWADVAVFKELEDVKQPTRSTTGAATFRNDSSLTRVVSPVGDQEINEGWIPLGRDAALEQEILAKLQSRLAPRQVRSGPSGVY